MSKIIIIGHGVVGYGIHKVFKNSVVGVIDPNIDENKIHDLLITDSLNENLQRYDSVDAYIEKSKLSNVKDGVDMFVVCVPTNAGIDGRANTELLEYIVEQLGEYTRWNLLRPVILIKSTTPPSVLKNLNSKYDNVVFSPEYMGESKYFTPYWKYPDPQRMETHGWQTFGGRSTFTNACVDIFIEVLGATTKFYQTDIVTAGLAKYMENAYFATKVTFCNEFAQICEAFGVSYNNLREIWLADPRVEPMHTAVFTKNRGYGGKCFPKDVKAIIADSINYGRYVPELLKSVDQVNTKIRSLNVSANNAA